MIALSHCCPGGRLMNGDDEACVDLRRCWRTFMVDSADQSQRQEQGSDAKGAQHHLGHDELTLLRRYRVVGTEEDEQSLFFLSLISPNAELLRATSHLFTQLNFQFRQLAVENEGKVMLLRNYHEEQLTNLLEASNVEAGDMIVGSDITEHFVLKHQRELEELQQENCYTESVLMLELRENFFTFLKTSAHGTMDSLEHGAGWLKLRQDDEQRKHVANISSFCGPRFPVRVLELPNLLRKKLGGFRVKDPLLRPVVVDISPLANLRDCLFCLYAENQAAAQAVEEHLLRLSRQIHALLFFIGSEEEARSILTNKYAELFLTNDGVSPPKSSCRFVPLRHHPSLKIMLSTQFWGANIILLWSPAPHSRDASLEASIVEDVLSLALAWNVDMLSVAVLKSAAHSQSAAAGGPDEQGRDVAVEALRQLQHGVGTLSYEAAVMKASAMWGGSEETDQWRQKQPFDDGQGVVLPTSARDSHLEFNLPMSIRMFLPFPLDFTEETVSQPPPEETATVKRHNILSSIAAGVGLNRVISSQGEGSGAASPADSVRRFDSRGLGVMSNSSFGSNAGGKRENEHSESHSTSFDRILVYNFGSSVVIR